jgi:aspartyl protease family protein
MVRFFTVKWPRLARLEACLLFAADVLMCGRLQVVRSNWITSLDVLTDGNGLPEQLFYWPLLSMILAGPYLCLMMLVDRLLALRRGFALLSIFSLLAWIMVAVALSREWAALSPTIAREGTSDFTLKAAIAAGTVSLLLHFGALRSGSAGVRPPLTRQPDRLGDRDSIFGDYGQTQPWSLPKSHTQTGQAPQRRNGALLLGMLAWGCIFTTAMGGYVLYHEGSITDPYFPENQQPLPRVITTGTQPSTPRTHDGHYVFAAMVNGHPVSMLFDTGASMVTLRAEEADRLGIPVSRLNFSARVSTANGIGLVAPTVIDTLTVGTVTQHNVPAFVARPGTLRENLLGQSFLSKLRSYGVENNRVVLKAD